MLFVTRDASQTKLHSVMVDVALMDARTALPRAVDCLTRPMIAKHHEDGDVHRHCGQTPQADYRHIKKPLVNRLTDEVRHLARKTHRKQYVLVHYVADEQKNAGIAAGYAVSTSLGRVTTARIQPQF